MQGAPYRFHETARAPTIRWWAGGVGLAFVAVAALGWLTTIALGSQRETWGVAGAQLASYPTGFAVGCLLLAKRTRYRPDRAARVAAPLAAGLLGGWMALSLALSFFALVWPSL